MKYLEQIFTRGADIRYRNKAFIVSSDRTEATKAVKTSWLAQPRLLIMIWLFIPKTIFWALVAPPVHMMSGALLHSTPCKAAIEFQGWHGLPPLSFEGTRPTAMGTHLLGIVHDDLDLGEVEVRSMFKLRFRI